MNIVTQIFDLALMKILSAASGYVYPMHRKGKERDRIRDSVKGKGRIVADRKQKAIEIACTIAGRSNYTRNRLAKEVKKKWGDGAPKTLNTIKDYLKDEWENLGVKV